MGDALRLPTREHTKSLLLLLKTSSSETKKQDRQEDEGGHLGPLALGGCSGPFSDGADDGGVRNLEDRQERGQHVRRRLLRQLSSCLNTIACPVFHPESLVLHSLCECSSVTVNI